MTIEKRAAHEMRAEGRTIAGYVATFHNPTRVADFEETIAPGAFAESLRSNPDILALQDHSYDKVIGRTSNGSLKLSEDAKGLRFELTPPETQAGRDALEMVRTRTAGGLSFGFSVPAGGDEWLGDKRTLKNVRLVEISLVSAFPAYSGTSATVRSRQERTTADRRIALLDLEAAR